MITALTWLGASLFVALLLGWAHDLYWTRRFDPIRRYALVERLRTEDGSAIELRRVTPAEVAEIDRVPEPPRSGLPPVLVVHGIGIDHRNNDMFDGRSIVRALAARGRDVWLLTLRSGLPDLGWRARGRTTFGNMARFDLPLAVREVRARTGTERLDYLGFSMGGMLLYGALAIRTIEPAVLRRVAIVGSPGRVEPPLRIVGWLARIWPSWLVPGLWLAWPSRMVAFLAGHLRTPIHHLLTDPEQLGKGDVGPALITIRDIPPALMGDFARFVRLGRLEIDGIEVLPALGALEIPALFVAGAGDRIAPPDAVRAGHDAWGASHKELDKRWHLASKANGGSSDHGHGDLAFGKHVPETVFPAILAHLGEP